MFIGSEFFEGSRAAQEGSAHFQETAEPPTPEIHRDRLHRYHGW